MERNQKENQEEVEYDETEELEQGPSSQLNPSHLTKKPFAHFLGSYSDSESYLFDYFIHGIGPKCSLSESDNPYISLLTPLFFFSQTFRHALLATAANQLRLSGDTRFSTEACHFKGMALQGLQQDISVDTCNDSIAATVLMLCFQDVPVPETLSK